MSFSPAPTHTGMLHLSTDGLPVQMVIPPRATAPVQLCAALVAKWAEASGLVVKDAAQVADAADGTYAVRSVVFFDGSVDAQAWHPANTTDPDYILVYLDEVRPDSDDETTNAFHLDAIRLLAGARAVWVQDVPVYMHLQRRYGVPQDRLAVVPSLGLGCLCK
jgi:hypothetical protein